MKKDSNTVMYTDPGMLVEHMKVNEQTLINELGKNSSNVRQ